MPRRLSEIPSKLHNLKNKLFSKKKLDSVVGNEKSTDFDTVEDSSILQSIDEFNLENFFDNSIVVLEKKDSGILEHLKQESQQAVQTYTKKITAQSFSDGLNLTTNIFSSLGNIIGACGPICAHSLGAVGNMGSSLSSVAGGGSLGGLNFDGKGDVSFSGSISDLAKRTGLSSADIASGKYSVEDLLSIFIDSLGHGIETVGCGLIHCLLDGLIPTPKAR